MAELPILDGPTLPPAEGGAPEQLVVLLHGIGADGQDLISLAPLLQRTLPGGLFVSPNAPFEYELAPVGYQWFGFGDYGTEARLSGARTAAPIVDAFIDAKLAEYGLNEDRLALIGFSQGAMMSLHVGLRRHQPIAGILSYSGMLVGGEMLAEEIRSRPPVLLVHGDADPVIPVQALPAAVAELQAVGVEVQSHVIPGLGHGIDEACVELGVAYLARIFNLT